MSKSNVINYPQNMHQPQVVKIYEKIKIHIKAFEVLVLSISHSHLKSCLLAMNKLHIYDQTYKT